MKIFLFLIIALMFSSCSECEHQSSSDEVYVEDVNTLKSLNSLGAFPYNQRLDEMTVVVIDGCEYIVCNAYENKDITITHKGNCTNAIHYQVIHDTIR
jgi:hypothetical protein